MSLRDELGRLALTAMICTVSACSSDSVPAEGDASIEASALVVTTAAEAVAVPLEGSVSLAVNVMGAGERLVELYAENIPAGLGVAFDRADTTASSTMTITASAAAVAGHFPLTIRARDSSRIASASLQVDVIASAPDFVLALVPPNASVYPGSTVGISVNVARTIGFTGVVDVQIDGLPAELTGPPISIGANATSGVLNVTASTLATGAQTTRLSVVARAGTIVKKTELALHVAARAATVDTSFGELGASFLPFASGVSNRFLLLRSGNVLVLGYANTPNINDQRPRLLRLLADGSADSTFGIGGTLDLRIPGREWHAAQAIETAAGKIVLIGSSRPTGTSSSLTTFVSLNPDGSFDSTFGASGVTLVDGAPFAHTVIETSGSLLAVASHPEGKRLVRLSLDGLPSAGFGTNGVKALGTPLEAAVRLIASGGNVIVLGATTDDPAGKRSDMVLVRLDGNGDLDTAFGTAGRATIDYGAQDQPGAILAQTDGKLVIAGTSSLTQQFGRSACSVARLSANGVLDASFGNGGKVLVGSATGASCFGLVQQLDGKILALGASGAPDQDATIYRFGPNGMLDPTFNNGRATVSLGSTAEWFSAARVLPDGRLLAFGETYHLPTGVATVRFWL